MRVRDEGRIAIGGPCIVSSVGLVRLLRVRRGRCDALKFGGGLGHRLDAHLRLEPFDEISIGRERARAIARSVAEVDQGPDRVFPPWIDGQELPREGDPGGLIARAATSVDESEEQPDLPFAQTFAGSLEPLVLESLEQVAAIEADGIFERRRIGGESAERANVATTRPRRDSRRWSVCRR